ncbi:AAA family ATPase [Gordonia sp. NB41Y]|uniref:AAA family ATPase n=1 Tax=Gordonia sp. NB41Y TaxID=875808 RepID=UPI000345296B|nr:AAA family ATPase [Gordonia sp. NB41Y]WLP89118.1 AAA family ATPase [Gordonia sp. NB41Y]
MENAKTLVQLGWHPIPLGGEGGKVLLVGGVTGHGGVDVTDEEAFREWADRWAATGDGLNLATRMPVGVIAIDVDCYDGKPGALTLAEHEQRWGALPATWSVTARTDGSRKLFFRVPGGWTARGVLGAGVEIVQRHHRYSVAPPSVHDAGLVKAFAPNGDDCGQLPPPDELPALPETWLAGLAHDAASTRKGSDEDAAVIVGSFRGGAMTPKVLAHLNAFLTAVAERSNRFDAMRDAVMGLVRLGAKGERGVDAALRLIEAEYVDAVADKRGGERTAREEFQKAKHGSAQIVAGDSEYWAMDYETGEAFGPEGLWGPGSRWTPVVVGGESLWQRTRGEEPATESEARVRFEAVPASALSGAIPPMQWMVKGVWALNSFGPLSGEKKTLKSYNLLSLSVAVASGEPFFGEFEVVSPGPVLYFAAEGGRDEHQRRLQTIARAYGVPLDDLPLYTVFEAGALDSPELLAAVKGHLDQLQPRLVVIDPLYAFHPTGVEAQNLYERGRMLSAFQSEVGNETSLIIADHFNKTGKGDLDLDSIAQAGMGQWADSWILQRHREQPDMDGGKFNLTVQFGSRRWGGRDWNLDWALASAEAMERGEVGEVSWTIARSTGTRNGQPQEGELALRILRELWKTPGVHTKSELSRMVTGRKADIGKEIDRLMEEGVVYEQPTPRSEGQRTVKRNLLFANKAEIKVPGAGK